MQSALSVASVGPDFFPVKIQFQCSYLSVLPAMLLMAKNIEIYDIICRITNATERQMRNSIECNLCTRAVMTLEFGGVLAN